MEDPWLTLKLSAVNESIIQAAVVTVVTVTKQNLKYSCYLNPALKLFCKVPEIALTVAENVKSSDFRVVHPGVVTVGTCYDRIKPPAPFNLPVPEIKVIRRQSIS